MRDLISVVMLTSPIPSNPDISILEATYASVREQEPLKDCEVFIVADGVRLQQIEQRKKNYDQAVRNILWRAEHEWQNVLPIVMPQWGHQGNGMRAALERVRTPLVVFMEHDTPLEGEFDWAGLTRAGQDERVNMIRFHHEAQVHPEHRHMMLDVDPRDICGVPLLRTYQWSQRPHLAKSDFYRDIIGTYFGVESRTMIEDVMHGVVETSCLIAAQETSLEMGWEKFKIWMYSPDGPSIKRSTHLDGRENDPKFDMYFEYDGHETPYAAPARTAGRVD